MKQDDLQDTAEYSSGRKTTQRFTLQDGDCLLLCSDGLTKHVEDAEIAEEISREADPQKVCQSLLDLALERGGKDNITVVIGCYEIPEQESGETK